MHKAGTAMRMRVETKNAKRQELHSLGQKSYPPAVCETPRTQAPGPMEAACPSKVSLLKSGASVACSAIVEGSLREIL